VLLPLAIFLACFLWGFAEATVFFLVPDLIIGLAALSMPALWGRCAYEALLGALAGGALAYWLGEHHENAYLRFVTRLPGHPPAFVERIRGGFRSRSASALLLGGFVGRPFKVYALEAGASRWNAYRFLALCTLARGARFFLTAYLLSRAALLLEDRRIAAVSFFMLALAASVLYLSAIERKYRRRRGDADGL
jgi:membrane protein YqaA with SNARE-associated domain